MCLFLLALFMQHHMVLQQVFFFGQRSSGFFLSQVGFFWHMQNAWFWQGILICDRDKKQKKKNPSWCTMISSLLEILCFMLTIISSPLAISFSLSNFDFDLPLELLLLLRCNWKNNTTQLLCNITQQSKVSIQYKTFG